MKILFSTEAVATMQQTRINTIETLSYICVIIVNAISNLYDNIWVPNNVFGIFMETL